MPVDYVSNLILAAAAYTASQPPGTLKIVHSSSSCHSPITILEMAAILLAYTKTNPSFKQVMSPKVEVYGNAKVYNTMFYLRQHLPIQIMHTISALPVVGNKTVKEQMATFLRLIEKMKGMQAMFVHFLNSEFIYDGKNSDEIWNSMNNEDKKLLPFNVRHINWTKCLQGF